MELKPCPRCGKPTEDLLPIDTGMKVALESTGSSSDATGQVCPNCYDELTSKVSQGVKLRMEQETREKNKMMMWKSRVNLIKQARQHMTHKAYSEAAVAYEKYIRVLEIVYNLKKGELTPSVFNNSARSKELTVVASVYWDLMRIYDTSPRYGDRMQQAAQKLALFLNYSPLYPDIVKKAEGFARTAKNPHVVRNFLKSTKSGHSRCFIATAVYSAPSAEPVLILRRFRDERLKSNAQGRRFVAFYYRYSPRWAAEIDKRPWLQSALKPGVALTAAIAKYLLKSPPAS